MAGIVKEFKEFAIKGSMVDMAVGIVIGAAFGTVVKSVVDDLIMPIVSGIFSAPDFQNLFIVLRNPTGAAYTSLQAARDSGAAVLAIGSFLNALIAFLLVAAALFMVVKAINKVRREPEKPTEAPPAPTREEAILAEIRDILQQQATPVGARPISPGATVPAGKE